MRIVGKGRKERYVGVRARIIDRVRAHFHGSTYLFEHHGKQYNRISVTNRIKHESLRTIGREVTAQQLRHTWAVTQIQRGRAISAVAAALGHLDPGLTVRMYCEETLGPREEVFLDIEEHEQDDRMKKGPSHRGARRERKITGEDKAKKT